jgi:hypothetical protein
LLPHFEAHENQKWATEAKQYPQAHSNREMVFMPRSSRPLVGGLRSDKSDKEDREGQNNCRHSSLLSLLFFFFLWSLGCFTGPIRRIGRRTGDTAGDLLLCSKLLLPV